MVNKNARVDPEGVIVRAADGFLCFRTVKNLKGQKTLGATKKADTPVAITGEETVFESMSIKELKAWCKVKNVKFNIADTKAKLIKKINEFLTAETDIPEDPETPEV